MTDTFNPELKPALGVGRLISQTFGLYFRKFIPFFLIAFIPLVVFNLISNSFIGDQMLAATTGNVPDPLAIFTPAYFVAIGLGTLAFFFILSFMTLAAYDAVQGRPMNLGEYISTVLRSVLPIIVLSILAIIAVYVLAIFLLLPGLYVMGMFSVMVPAILVERVGFRGLGRSMGLTKHYRWPVLGAWVLLFIVVIIISIPVGVLFGFVGAATGIMMLSFVSALSSALSYGIMAVFTALLYARLREIKDGVGIEDLTDVFA